MSNTESCENRAAVQARSGRPWLHSSTIFHMRTPLNCGVFWERQHFFRERQHESQTNLNAFESAVAFLGSDVNLAENSRDRENSGVKFLSCAHTRAFMHTCSPHTHQCIRLNAHLPHTGQWRLVSGTHKLCLARAGNKSSTRKNNRTEAPMHMQHTRVQPTCRE